MSLEPRGSDTIRGGCDRRQLALLSHLSGFAKSFGTLWLQATETQPKQASAKRNKKVKGDKNDRFPVIKRVKGM